MVHVDTNHGRGRRTCKKYLKNDYFKLLGMMKKIFGYLAMSLIILSCKGKAPTNLLHTDSPTKKRLIPYSVDSSVQGSRQEPFLKISRA